MGNNNKRQSFYGTRRNIHPPTILIKAHTDNLKKNMLNSNIASTCPHNMVNVSPVTAEISSGVWAHQQISMAFVSLLC